MKKLETKNSGCINARVGHSATFGGIGFDPNRFLPFVIARIRTFGDECAVPCGSCEYGADILETPRGTAIWNRSCCFSLLPSNGDGKELNAVFKSRWGCEIQKEHISDGLRGQCEPSVPLKVDGKVVMSG